MAEHHNLIAGDWVSGEDLVENINPSDLSDVIGHYARAGRSQVDLAVCAARGALLGWSQASPQFRADILDSIGLGVLAQKDNIARLLSREQGKTLAEATAETERAAQVFRFFSGEAVRVAGDAIASIRPNVDVDVTREPVGVVGLITPWNFPIAIPAWKIAPALAYGNTVVFKPADLTPGSAHLLTKIIHDAGLPKGVFNLVMGSGSVVGSALVSHADVDAISFTGSVPVGRALAAQAVKSLKKIQLEMGGKNPMLVMNDADLDIADPACINGSFFSTGQRCTASSRLIVEDRIYDEFLDRLSRETSKLIVGDALDPTTNVGPVASAKQLKSNLSYVALAREEGATILGGEVVECNKAGFYQRPAIFADANNHMRSSREEIFGPCASVIKAAGYEEALAMANDTEFGLTSGICTSSLKMARHFRKYSQVGMVMVNLPTAGVDYHVPFGGRKGSSYGSREQGRYAADFYTNTKTAYSYAG